MADNILVMDHITKEFPGVKALDNVNLEVQRGEIHALIGENGAGKSTLMNVLSGQYPYGSYTGTVTYEGEECKFKNLNDSEAERYRHYSSGTCTDSVAFYRREYVSRKRD